MSAGVSTGSSHIPKVNGEDISKDTHNEAIEVFQSEEGHIVVQVLWKNVCSWHSRRVDVATQTDLPSYTGVVPPALCSTSLSDGCYFLHGSTANLHCSPSTHLPNTAPRVGREHHHEAQEENKANADTLCESPNLQDKDSGLGYMDSSRQNEEESEQGATGEEGNCERCRELGRSSDQLVSDEPCLRDSITSDEWSDSGFYSISHREYERFQKVLEMKWQLYTSRNKSELGKNTLTEVKTKSKWENNPKAKLRQSQEEDGLKKHRSGEASDLIERAPVMDQQKSLQTYPATSESSPNVNRFKRFHQNYTTAPLRSGPSIAQHSLPSPVCDITRRGNSAPEGENSEQEEKQKTGPDSSPVRRYNLESDSGQGSVHIPQRARHYQSYMRLVQHKAAVECSTSLSDNGVDGRGTNRSGGSLDVTGTSFTTKKQLREQLLKDRAMKIGEERTGMTTDDDNLSEIKLGRYWSRVERRQHWAQAREKRQKKEMKVQSRLEIVNESAQTTGNGRTGSSIIELSQRIASRKRNKKIFDNWVTIQELLAHGSPAADGTMVYSPLLSVTTV